MVVRHPIQHPHNTENRISASPTIYTYVKIAIKGVSVKDTDESAVVQAVDSMAGFTMMTPNVNRVT